MQIRIIEFDSSEYRMELELRNRILREPLGLKFSDEELKAEGAELHLGAFDSKNKLVGCLVLKPVDSEVVKMRQVAVEPEFQGRGIGKSLVVESEKLAADKGFNKIILYARDTAVDFYRRLEYEIEGEMFIEVTIPHYKMKEYLR